MISADRPKDQYALALAGNEDDESSWNWELVPGEHIEVRRSGGEVRRGIIEAVMNDESGFWLAAHGVEPRVFVALEDKGQSIRAAQVQPEVNSTRRHSALLEGRVTQGLCR